MYSAFNKSYRLKLRAEASIKVTYGSRTYQSSKRTVRSHKDKARNFISYQLKHDIKCAIVFQDNMSTMTLIEKGRSTSSRTKHINIRYFFVKDRVENGEITIKYLPTEEMVADLLTKPLQGQLFRKLRQKLLNMHANDDA
jgi:hypothetical protein